MQRSENPGSGFTLVELLVVIAIITVLAGLLFPVLGQALSSARTISCQSNMRQVFTALNYYGDDNRSHLPHLFKMYADGCCVPWSFVLSTRAGSRMDVTHHLPGAMEYVPWTSGVYNCPAREDPRLVDDWHRSVDVGLNSCMDGDNDEHYRLSRTRSPSRHIFGGETRDQWSLMIWATHPAMMNPDGTSKILRHGKQQMNVFFFDGHLTAALPAYQLGYVSGAVYGTAPNGLRYLPWRNGTVDYWDR